MRKNIAIFAAAALVTGCAALENAFDASDEHFAAGMADAFATYCSLPVAKRQQLWPQIQANLDRRGLGLTTPVFDCDGDGQPDFDPKAGSGQ